MFIKEFFTNPIARENTFFVIITAGIIFLAIFLSFYTSFEAEKTYLQKHKAVEQTQSK